MNARTLITYSLILLALPMWAQTSPAPSALDAQGNYRTGRELEVRGKAAEAAPYYAQAVTICTNQIAQNQANSASYRILCWTLQRQKKYTDVVTWGERGLTRFPGDMDITETMGEAYFYLDDYPNSLKFMERYVNTRPQGDRASVAYFFIGEIYRLQQKYRHADIAYTTAVQLTGGNALWWYRLGMARESAGDKPEAAEAYKRALALRPAYPQAQTALQRVNAPAAATGTAPAAAPAPAAPASPAPAAR